MSFCEKIETLFIRIFEYSEPGMNRKQQEQGLFKQTADLLADDKITPEQACSFIETLRQRRIFADDILESTDPEQERQKGFNEIAGLFADWCLTTEEACELFVEWVGEVNAEQVKPAQEGRKCESDGGGAPSTEGEE